MTQIQVNDLVKVNGFSGHVTRVGIENGEGINLTIVKGEQNLTGFFSWNDIQILAYRYDGE